MWLPAVEVFLCCVVAVMSASLADSQTRLVLTDGGGTAFKGAAHESAPQLLQATLLAAVCSVRSLTNVTTGIHAFQRLTSDGGRRGDPTHGRSGQNNRPVPCTSI